MFYIVCYRAVPHARSRANHVRHPDTPTERPCPSPPIFYGGHAHCVYNIFLVDQQTEMAGHATDNPASVLFYYMG